LQAALDEFYARGYDGASTNRMIQAAGVSKGILFHHFTDKKTLYLSVVDDCLDRYMQAAASDAEESSGDLFETIGRLSARKLERFRSDPVRFGFMTRAFAAMPDELRPELEARKRRMRESAVPLLASRIDRNRFRDGVDPERAIAFALLALEAVLSQAMGAAEGERDDGEIGSGATFDLAPYVDMLRYGLMSRREEDA